MILFLIVHRLQFIYFNILYFNILYFTAPAHGYFTVREYVCLTAPDRRAFFPAHQSCPFTSSPVTTPPQAKTTNRLVSSLKSICPLTVLGRQSAVSRKALGEFNLCSLPFHPATLSSLLFYSTDRSRQLSQTPISSLYHSVSSNCHAAPTAGILVIPTSPEPLFFRPRQFLPPTFGAHRKPCCPGTQKPSSHLLALPHLYLLFTSTSAHFIALSPTFTACSCISASHARNQHHVPAQNLTDGRKSNCKSYPARAAH
ncbi:hypothetical protein B0T26DRAFT_493851 [Lasiosphaeria miniovina]|uniref:Uncharacterized protein n=1 Tax=Lasiosphaeria miniovina TaxID=1954250 RepID=A0AA39ZTI5_9PEZI|nr:uncharacterized protein B0T26DRAFT_493851 [Lasiosphaeria miniovina]KAK0703275.1 hypothetical protein B0T26DRAFT_493851 [Lasiosphaeria miniovina]